jgi:hypothetical protein
MMGYHGNNYITQYKQLIKIRPCFRGNYFICGLLIRLTRLQR